MVSTSIGEGLQNSLIEAISFGARCFATNVGDNIKIVGKESVVENLDMSLLASMVVEDSKHQEKDKEVILKQKALDVSQLFGRQSVIHKYKALYDEK